MEDLDRCANGCVCTPTTRGMNDMKIDLSEAYDLLHQADQSISVLQGMDFTDPESWRGGREKPGSPANSREHRAQVSRDLLHLEHLLHAAASEVSKAYWRGKGYDN